MKETQGSIEETTFGQMNNILTYGCYQIGSRRPQIFLSIHDIIHLTLTERDKPLTKKAYNLNELQDLESKLALIVGKNAENRTEVGVFTHTLHNVCRIAEVLISLQQVGKVKYTGWRLHVPCGIRYVVPLLQDQAKEMEHELINWEEEVIQKRGEFYELNYFTTLQLLTLRRALGVMKSKSITGPADITFDVLALLESISTQVSAAYVHKAVQNVIVNSARPASVTPIPYPNPLLLGADSSSVVSLHEELSLNQTSSDMQILSDVETMNADMTVNIEMPKITEGELTQEQKGIMEDLINQYEFPNYLVLKAFEECKDNPKKYDIQNWCLENLEKYDFLVEVQKDISDEEYCRESDVSSTHSDDEMYMYQQVTPPLNIGVYKCMHVCIHLVCLYLFHCYSFSRT